jgi:hypothetical protein
MPYYEGNLPPVTKPTRLEQDVVDCDHRAWQGAPAYNDA